MNDQDQINEEERQEAATETPAFLGCPQHMPKTLPGGIDGVEPGDQGGEGVPPSQDVEKLNSTLFGILRNAVIIATDAMHDYIEEGLTEEDSNVRMLAACTEIRKLVYFYKPRDKPVDPSAPETPDFLGCPQHMPTHLPSGFDGTEPGGKSKSEVEVEELKKRGEKLKACNDRSRARIVDIAHLANECLLNTNHPNGYEPGQYGRDYRTYGKAFGEIRKHLKESIADVAPDYEMLALQFARDSFDFSKFQEAMAAVASMKQDDFTGTYYTPGWLVELAKKLGAEQPKSQSEIQREEARQKRKIHWKVYPTKVDLCAMGRTEQNGKVYEVRISKRGDSKVQDTYGQCKVNGKTVITCSFTGNAWMLKRILTGGMQALVNYKAKKARDSRRNYAKRDAARAAKKGGAK